MFALWMHFHSLVRRVLETPCSKLHLLYWFTPTLARFNPFGKHFISQSLSLKIRRAYFFIAHARRSWLSGLSKPGGRGKGRLSKQKWHEKIGHHLCMFPYSIKIHEILNQKQRESANFVIMLKLNQKKYKSSPPI